MNVKRILFPVDLSDFSSSIVQQVISIAGKYGAEIHLVAVLECLESGTVPRTRRCLTEETLFGAEQRLLEIEREDFIKYRKINRTLLVGIPAREILKYIAREGIDLVVMATHRKNELTRTLLGSVADEVIRKSPVPVMSINPAEEEMGWRVSGVDPEQELRLRPEWPDVGC